MPTNWLISNAAANGYGLGNDSTGNGTLATPYLTGVKALSVAASGDTITYNSTGIPYREDNATNGLNIGLTAVTIQTDPTQVLSLGKVTLRGNGTTSTKVVNVGGSAGAIVLSNLIIDCETLAINGIAPHNQTGAGLTLTGVVIKNVPSGHNAIAAFSSTGNVLNLIDSSCGSDVVNYLASADFGGSGGITILGGSYSPSQSMTAGTFPGSNALNLTITKDSNGNRPSFSGCASGAFQLKGVGATAIACSFTDFSGNWADFTASPATPMTNLTSLIVHDCTMGGTVTQWSIFLQNVTSSNIQIYNNVCTNSIGLVTILAELSSNILVHDNQVTLGSSSAQLAINIAAGTGCKAYNNTISITGNNISLLGIVIGSNGLLTDSSNVTTTTTHKLFDQTSNTYLSQQFHTSALTSSGRASWCAGFLFQLSSSGSPTGSITFTLHADNAGAPASATLETAVATIPCSSLTASNQAFYVEFKSSQLTAATAYWITATVTSGSVSASNYVIFQSNTTVTNGSLSTSADGSTWSNDSTHALLYNAYSYFGSMTDCVVGPKNVVTSTAVGTDLVHGILIGAVGGGTALRNKILDCSLGVVTKDCYGVTVYSNFIKSSLSSQGLLFAKGSHNTTFANNTVIQNAGGTASCVEIVQDNLLGVNSNPSGTVVENNILIYGAVGSGSNYIYQLNSNPAGTYPTATINNNCLFGKDAFVIIEKNRYATFAAWQTAGFDTVGKVADPGLANEVNPITDADFMLTSNTGPAVGMGTNLVTTAPLDYFNNYFHVKATVGAHSIATNELLTHAASGSTVNAKVFSAGGATAGQVWNTSTKAYESYITTNLALYCKQQTPIGTASGLFIGNMSLEAPAGEVRIEYTIQAGVSPAESDTKITDTFSRMAFWWTGTTLSPIVGTDSSGHVTAGTVLDKSSYALGTTGLDLISIADPGAPSNWTTFSKILVALYRKFLKPTSLTGSQLTLYQDDGVTVNAIQTVSDNGITQTQGKAS